MSSVNNPPPPFCFSKKTLKTLRMSADAMAIYVTNNYIIRHPECLRMGEEKLRQICKADLNHHLQFLLYALETGDYSIFLSYVSWLTDVFISRNLAINDGLDSLDLMLDFFKLHCSVLEIAQLQALFASAKQIFNQQGSFLSASYQAAQELALPAAKTFTQHLIMGNRKTAENYIFEQINTGVELIDAEIGIIQPALYEIGYLWQKNRLTVAQEHLATAICQNILARLFLDTEAQESNGKKILLAGVTGNFHSLGLRMISDAFEVSGWDVTFLGVDVPSTSIKSMLDQQCFDVIGLSVSLPSHIMVLKTLIDEIKADFSSKVPAIIIGGQSLNDLGHVPHSIYYDEWMRDARAIKSF